MPEASAPADQNKRIASNTFFLFVRLLFVMAVTLYVSRALLEVLGVVDFGIFSLISVVATSFIFFSSSLSNATQRFLSYELGRADARATAEVFGISLSIYAALSLLALLVGEGVGLYLMHCELDIPGERFEAALWVFHATVFSVVIQLFGTLYESVLIARENMRLYAWVGMLEALLKLGAILALFLVPADKLKAYALLYGAAISAVRIIPIVVCTRRYAECRPRLLWRGDKVRQMLGFMGWNGLGTAIYVLVNNGADVLLNVFFGPVLNAAKGIASQINGAVGNFSINFFSAVRPQIVKNYAAGQSEYLVRLIYAVSRYGVYMMWVVTLPIIARMDYVLGLWLGAGRIPAHTADISVWVLLCSLVNVINLPLWYALQATGHIRHFTLLGGAISLTALPIAYAGLYAGQGAVYPFVVLAVVRAFHSAAAWYSLRRYMDLRLRHYWTAVLRPVALVILTSGAILLPLNTLIAADFLGLILYSALSLALTLAVVWLLGLEGSERAFVRRTLARKLLRRA